MTIFLDYKVWLSVIFGFIVGWFCIWLSGQFQSLLKIIAIKRQFFWRIIDLLFRVLGTLIFFSIGVFIPLAILPRGVKHPLFYFDIYFIAFVIGALIRLPKLIKWMKVNQSNE